MRRTPTRVRSTRLAVAALASFAMLGLAACGDDSDSEDTAATASPSASPTESDAPEDESEADDAEATGDQPDWADPVTTPGDKLTTIEVDDVTVDVYQVGTAKATKTGQFVNPENNKPIIEEGDDIVFLNYVVTNNGDDIDLGSSGVRVESRYDDWPFMQGMDSIVDTDLFEAQDVNSDAFADDAYREPPVYTFASGQTISFGENFAHQKDSPINFKVTMTPVDAEGDLVHDDRVEAEGTAKIS